MATIYSIVMNKGGVGKTTFTANFAGVLSEEKDSRVLIIDSDGQANSAYTFGIDTSNYQNTIYDVYMGKCTIKDVTVNVRKNIDIALANKDMNLIEFDIYNLLEARVKEDGKSEYTILKDALKEVVDEYDYIIIDTPPSLGFVTRNGLIACDEVIIPFQPTHFAGKGLVSMINEIDEFKLEQGISIKIAGIVGMMLEKKTIVHSTIYQTAKDYCASRKIPFMKRSIPKSTVYEKAITFDNLPATLVTTRKKASKAVKPFFEIVDEILEREVVVNG
jgi:chromosome partitioning protein